MRDLRAWNTQKTEAETIRLNIIKELSGEDLNFTQLLNKLKIDRTTLARHLKKLRNMDIIFKLYDKKKGRDVYSASNETIIKQVILPELMAYIATRIIYDILKHKVKVDEEQKDRVIKMYEPIEEPRTQYHIEQIFDDVLYNYSHRNITAQKILNIMMSSKLYHDNLKIMLIWEKLNKQEKEKALLRITSPFKKTMDRV